MPYHSGDNGTVSIRFSDYPRGMYILTITANDFTGKRESEQFRFNVTTGIVGMYNSVYV